MNCWRTIFKLRRKFFVLEATFARCTCTFRKGRCRGPAVGVQRSPTRTPSPAQDSLRGPKLVQTFGNEPIVVPATVYHVEVAWNFFRWKNFVEPSHYIRSKHDMQLSHEKSMENEKFVSCCNRDGRILKPSSLGRDVLETFYDNFLSYSRMVVREGKRLKGWKTKNGYSGPFPCGQLRPGTYSRLHKGGPLLAVDVASSRGYKKATLQSSREKIRSRYCPSAEMPLHSRMNMTMMIPVAAWVALFLLLALSYPAVA